MCVYAQLIDGSVGIRIPLIASVMLMLLSEKFTTRLSSINQETFDLKGFVNNKKYQTLFCPFWSEKIY